MSTKLKPFPEVELSLRLRQKGSFAEKSITNCDDCIDLFKSLLCEKAAENLVIVCVDGKWRPICYSTVSIGSAKMSLAAIGTILRTALFSGASGIFVAHNHPSGDATPSNADIYAAQQIHVLSNLVDIALLDFLIIGGGYETSDCPAKSIRKFEHPANPFLYHASLSDIVTVANERSD